MIRRLCTFTGALGCILALASASAQVFDPYSGEESYHRFCSRCHGPAGNGDGPLGQRLPVAVPDLTTLKQRYGEYRREDLRGVIDGREERNYHDLGFMPTWGYEFWIAEGADSDADQRVEIIIENLLDYIESLQRDGLTS